MPAVELPPLTAAHREAIKACRFYTPNIARDRAWAWSDDVEVVRTLVPGAGMNEAERQAAGAAEHPRVAGATHYRADTDTDRWDWELAFTHPDAVAFICDLTDARDG